MSHHYHGGVLATSSASGVSALGWLWAAAVAHAPSWELVPPVLLAASSCVTAYWSGRKMLQELRHARELHELELARARAGLPAASANGQRRDAPPGR